MRDTEYPPGRTRLTGEHTAVDCDAVFGLSGMVWDTRPLHYGRDPIRSQSDDGLDPDRPVPAVAAGAACGRRHKMPFRH
jgi:hypothetical protein